LRRTSAFALAAGLLIAVVAGFLAVLAFTSGDGGRPWHYWMAPFLCIGVAALLLWLVAGYYLKIGGLELKERQRGG
jgi:hypothetical protein